VRKICLSNAEEVLLRRYFETSPILLIRLKAQAVVMRSQDMKLENIARVLFRNVRTVERWVKDFSNRRTGSIFSGLVGNENAAKLTRDQKRSVRKVLKQKPSDYGLPKEFWDVPTLKRYVYARFGVVYESAASYHFLLEFGRLSFKYPATFSVRRNEQQIIDRMEEIYGELLPLMENPEWEVFCADETRMQLEAITRRAWLPIGEKTVIKVDRSDDYQNYLGFLSQKTGRCHVLEIAWGKQDEIIRATTKFLQLYPGKKVCIVWDNAGCHKGKLVRRALSRNGPLARVHLIALPPYAPDVNPVEKVWNLAKNKLANEQLATFEKTKGAFRDLVNDKFFPYQI